MKITLKCPVCKAVTTRTTMPTEQPHCDNRMCGTPLILVRAGR